MTDIQGKTTYYLNTFNPTKSGTARLIRNRLILEDRVRNQDKQSAYFRWGFESILNQLEGLKGSYEFLRQRFNKARVDRLIEIIEEKEEFLREEVYTIFPIFVRVCHGSGARHAIIESKDFLHWKSITDSLPEWEELPNHPRIMEEVMRADV